MASLYKVTYRTNTDQLATNYATATSDDNAWVAVQSGDSTAKDLESIEEERQNVFIGS